MEIQHTTTGFPHPHNSHCGYELYFELVSDPPAVPRPKGDCAKEFLLPMLPPGCFEAGRLTLTQSSWTVSRHCSRKWMSGQAAALAAREIEHSSSSSTTTALRELIPLSAGGTPSPLDFYLSWMSLFLLSLFLPQELEIKTSAKGSLTLPISPQPLRIEIDFASSDPVATEQLHPTTPRLEARP